MLMACFQDEEIKIWMLDDVCLGVIESCIQDCSLNTFSDLMRTTKSNTEMMAPPLHVLSMGLLVSPYLARRKQFYFPLLLVSVQWGCLLHQACIHELFICVSTQQEGKTPVLNRLVFMAGLLFGRKHSNCRPQRLTDSYLRGGYYTAVNKMWERKSVCVRQKEKESFSRFGLDPLIPIKVTIHVTESAKIWWKAFPDKFLEWHVQQLQMGEKFRCPHTFGHILDIHSCIFNNSCNGSS